MGRVTGGKGHIALFQEMSAELLCKWNWHVRCSSLVNTGESEMCRVHGEFLWSPTQLQRHSSLNLRQLIRIIYVPLQHDAWWSCCVERKKSLAWEKKCLYFPKENTTLKLSIYFFRDVSVICRGSHLHYSVHIVVQRVTLLLSEARK